MPGSGSNVIVYSSSSPTHRFEQKSCWSLETTVRATKAEKERGLIIMTAVVVVVVVDVDVVVLFYSVRRRWSRCCCCLSKTYSSSDRQVNERERRRCRRRCRRRRRCCHRPSVSDLSNFLSCSVFSLEKEGDGDQKLNEKGLF